MAYTTEEGQQQVLDELSRATQEIGAALAALGEAHEQLDEQSAERLENGLFRPVQRAYALAQRTRSGFAGRAGLALGELPEHPRGAPSHGPKGFLEEAIAATDGADVILAELQDSMLPVEVGDPELRGGLSSVRELLSQVAPAARQMLRTLGR
jgi:hypothetical protein